MKRARIRVFARAALALFMLSAAGCSWKGEAGDPRASDTAGSEGSPGRHEQVTLTYASWGSPNERQAQERTLAKFMKKYPWIKVDYLFIPGDYITKLTTLYAANKPPDVFVLFKHTALQWAEQGKLYNLNGFLSRDPDINTNTLIPKSILYWDKDKAVGVKVGEEAFALYYNADLFRKANLDPPPVRAEDAWTWEEFVRRAQLLTLDENGRNAADPEFDPSHIKQYGVRFNTWMWHLLVPSNEASIISPDGSRVDLTNPDVIEAVQKLADLIYRYHVAPSPIQEKSLPLPDLALRSGKVAMDLNGQWVQLDLGASGMHYGVGVLPKLKVSRTILFGEPDVMSSTTKHPEEAWLLYKWLLSAGEDMDMYTQGLRMPILKDYYTKPELIQMWAGAKPGHADGYEEAVMKQTLENGSNAFEYYLKNLDTIAGILNPALDQVWLGKKSVREAFEGIADQVNAEFRGTYPSP